MPSRESLDSAIRLRTWVFRVRPSREGLNLIPLMRTSRQCWLRQPAPYLTIHRRSTLAPFLTIVQGMMLHLPVARTMPCFAREEWMPWLEV